MIPTQLKVAYCLIIVFIWYDKVTMNKRSGEGDYCLCAFYQALN